MRPEDGATRRGLLRRGFGWARAHPLLSSGAAFVGAGLLVFGILWFEPQKLIQEKTVNEALPTSSATTTPQKQPSTIRTPYTLVGGAFQSLEHRTAGKASIIRLADGSFILRLDDLDTSNGPDLRVYLSTVPASDDWYAYGRTGTYLELGELKGNRGNQNYAIPAGTDLSRYRSAVIWCVRFRVGFGVAPLNRA